MHHSKRRYAILIFLLLLTTYMYVLPKSNWNSRSRIFLVYAIVDQGTLNIDAYHEGTGDKAYFQGHYYTDKSIGPSIVALPAYFLAQNLLSDEANYRLGQAVPAWSEWLMTWFATSLPSALLGVVLFLFIARFTERLFHAALITLAYGLGTISFPYSTMLFQHQLATVFLFTGFFILWRVAVEHASRRWLWLAGLLFGLTAISEYILIFAGGLTVLWFLYKTRDLKLLIPLVLGAVPALLIFFAYNTSVYGSPTTVGYWYVAGGWEIMQTQGFFGLTAPSLDRLWGITFSTFRGLFFISPFLVLGFFGLYRLYDRSLAVLFAGIIAVLLIYNAAYVDWWGGYGIGPRHLIPTIPFLAASIGFVISSLLRRTWGRILVVGLILFSAANVWIQTYAQEGLVPDTLEARPDDASPPAWILEQYAAGKMLFNPLVDYAIPGLSDNQFTPTLGSFLLKSNGWLPTFVPLLVIWCVIVLVVGWLPALWQRSTGIRLENHPS